MVIIFVTYLVSRLLLKLWELYDRPDSDELILPT